MPKGKRGIGPKEDEEKVATQKRLPEMDDAEIEELEEAAQRYAKVRDSRVALSRKEINEKSELLKIMKKHKKTVYRHGQVSIEIIPEGERLKVRIVDEED